MAYQNLNLKIGRLNVTAPSIYKFNQALYKFDSCEMCTKSLLCTLRWWHISGLCFPNQTRKCTIFENKSDRISSSPHAIPYDTGAEHLQFSAAERTRRKKKVPCHLSTASIQPGNKRTGKKSSIKPRSFHCKSTLDPYSICRHFLGSKRLD